MAEPKRSYAAIPSRAMADGRLSALDLRVLMAIAAHDRLQANGVGCYASHSRLAALVGCHLKSLSRSMTTLAKCGYITGRANPLNQRTRIYNVVYTEFDTAFLKGAGGEKQVTSLLPVWRME
jgi:hypothetical protein